MKINCISAPSLKILHALFEQLQLNSYWY